MALLTGKLIVKITRAFQIGGGSAAPGLYSLKIYPGLIADLASQIPQTVVVTGTNGKTTTAKLLAHFAKVKGLKVLMNNTGSNLERGIASALISNSHLTGGKLKKFDLAIWELDEAAFNTLAPKLNPDIIIFLNVFRDQLDRYGEVDTTLKNWSQTLKKLPRSAKILINGDDQNLLNLSKSFQGKIVTFGVENYKIRGEETFKQLGQERLDLEAKNLNLLGLTGVSFELEESDGVWHFFLPLPGIYQVYNFLAAYIAASRLGFRRQSIIQSLQNFSPPFGRAEKFFVNQHDGYILLIKNPVGATQVFEILRGEIRPEDRLLAALNDNPADGTDVSWIWDANFDLFNFIKSEDIICSGSRAQDLALRLKYVGFRPEQLKVESNLEKAFQEATTGLEGRLFILPTYTALLKLQGILTKLGIKKAYWEEK